MGHARSAGLAWQVQFGACYPPAMLSYLILLCVGMGGSWQGRWWLILVGTFGLCIGQFADKWEMLRAHPMVPFD